MATGTVTVPGGTASPGSSAPPITYTFNSDHGLTVAQQIAAALAAASTVSVTASQGGPTPPVTPTGGVTQDLLLSGNPEAGTTVPGGYTFITNQAAGPVTINASPGTAIISSLGGGTFNETGPATIVASGGNNVISQTGAGSVSLAGGTGDDTISAEGTGLLAGGLGHNLILANGTGQFIGSSGTDTISMGPGSGSDTVDFSGSSGSKLVGGTGSMVVWGLGANETVVGGTGPETVFSGASGTYLFNAAPTLFVDQGIVGDTSTIIGGSGPSTIFGGGGSDSIFGGTGPMTYITSAPGTETVVGTSSQVTLFGGSGGNIVFDNGPSSQGALFVAGSGNETLNAAGATVGVIGWGAAASLSGANDVMIGGSAADTLIAGGGATSMTGGAGANIFDVISGRTHGSVTITDMTASASNTLNITGYDTAAASLAVSSAKGSSFTLSDGTTVTFQNVAVSSISSHIKIG